MGVLHCRVWLAGCDTTLHCKSPSELLACMVHLSSCLFCSAVAAGHANLGVEVPTKRPCTIVQGLVRWCGRVWQLAGSVVALQN